MSDSSTNEAESRRQGWLALAPLLVGMLLAGWLVHTITGKRTNFADAALGRETTSHYSSHQGHPIHCKGIEDAERCLTGARTRGGESAVLWLGNSQVHAVNQFEESQENAPPILFRRLAGSDLDLLTFSQPNANLQEHLVLFQYLRSRMDLEAVVLAVVFDDLRETGLRADIAGALRDPATLAKLEDSETGRAVLERHLADAEADAGLGGVHQTLQEHSERTLNAWLADNWSLWQGRADARGNLFLGLYRLRNTALGITPQTKRRKIPGRYATNMDALRTLAEEARTAGIRVLIYIAPLRDDLAIPYVETEYEAFKLDLERLAQDSGASLSNLEGLVPPELWGEKAATGFGGKSGVDFMHFRAAGHQMLAEALGTLLEARQPAP